MKKRADNIAVIILLIISTLSASGQRTVTGQLVDIETDKPVKDAVITRLGTVNSTVSNALGFFQIEISVSDSIKIEHSDYVTTQLNKLEANRIKIKLIKVTQKEVKEFKILEQPASFPGGMQSFYNYLGNNMKFPREVRNGAINGKVIVEFVIDSTGLIPPDEIKIKQGLCKSCDDEAVRLIKGSPKWNPGIQKDKPVRVKMTMPIVFWSN